MADPLSITSISGQLGLPLWLVVIVVIWSLVWKALALWKSARLGSRIWFIIILLVNTLGILEILYIFLFSKIKLPNAPRQEARSSKRAVKRKRKR